MVTKKILFLTVMVLFAAGIAKSQTAGDYYAAYESSIAKGDYEKAFKYIEACDNLVGHSPLSALAMGIMYDKGLGVPADSTKALVDGFGTAAYCLEHKTEAERKKAENMYQRLAALGSGMDMVADMKAKWAEDDKQYKEYMELDAHKTNVLLAFAFRWKACFDIPGIENALVTGDLEEKFASAAGVIQDAEEAIKLTDDAYSQYLIGMIWYEGHTGMKDRDKGLAYLEKSASRGCISALTYMGNIMKKKGNTAKAKEYWRKAASLDVKPMIPPTKANVEYFASSNIDINDVKIMKERAIANLKSK